eukprot:m.101157 g.101157  ORF g.101157 m.101157 type:complete len:240 (+) comp16795_c0_seq2:407-1126(+)
METGASRRRVHTDGVDPEKQHTDVHESIDSYYDQVKSSEFEFLVVDVGLVLAIIHLAYFVILYTAIEDKAVVFMTGIVFMPIHAINSIFHYKYGVDKPSLRPYFFFVLTAAGCLEAVFFILHLGLHSGFFCILLVALVWPVTHVDYATEAHLQLAAAGGLFFGGSACLYVHLRGTALAEYSLHPTTAERIETVPVEARLILTALNYMISLLSLIHANYRFLDTHTRMRRLESAIKTKDR